MFEYVLSSILILIAIRKYREFTWGRCSNKILLCDKVVIVTGANSGIGYEIAKDLAKRKARVIFACRNVEAAIRAIHRIQNELTFQSEMVAMELNLSSINSVRGFAKEIKETYKEIHLLINNAGVSYPKHKREKTEDGFEIHLGVNHCGHFLLTNLLLDVLKCAENCRIVIVSSILHEKGKIYLDDLNLEKSTDTNAYANSKLANAFFGNELAKRLTGTGLNIYCVCPGWVYTNLFRHYDKRWYHYIFILPVAFFFMRSAEQGAQTAIYCATDEKLKNESGFMYRNCKRYHSKINFDDKTSKSLWEITKKMVDMETDC